MSKPKFTPGPWTGVPRNDDNGLVTYIGPQDRFDSESIVAMVYTASSEREANARLIAAAPELLNAVRFVLEYHGRLLNEQTLDVLNEAVTKATGGTK